jgi:predicted acylesterase/phospholipase RssA
MPNALVISGGGARGAFAVGAIEHLRSQGIAFDLVAGTSTGALIAPLVVTDDIVSLRFLYTSVKNEDIVLQRDVVKILTHDAIYDTNPLWRLINSFVTPERYEAILASKIEVFLCTLNLQTGDAEYWNPHRSGPNGGPLGLREFRRAMLASASMPVLMPPVQILEGGHQHVDGGVRDIAPLKVAIDGGATDVYAILLEPERQAPSTEKYVFIVKTLLRSIDVFTREILADDLATALLYNQAILYWERLRTKAQGLLAPETFTALFEDPENLQPFAGKRLLNLFVIRPDRELPIDALEFNPTDMAQIMAEGGDAARRTLAAGPAAAL